MKILIDMNLSPEWVDYLQREGYIATHWRDIGSFEAKDIEITKWAMRICRMKLYELRDRPTNKRFQQTPKKRRGR